MARGDERARQSTTDFPTLRRYLVRVAKVWLCVSCWVGISTLLLMHGPPAMRVSNGPADTSEIVPAVLGSVLSVGAGALLTIVLGIFVLAATGWHRTQNTEETNDTPDIPKKHQ